MTGRHEADWVPDTTAGPYQPKHGLQVTYVCDRCGRPAFHREDGWVHAEAADAVFCLLVMRREWPDAQES